MSSAFLKWVANGLIVVVLVATLWMAYAINPGQGSAGLLIAQVGPAAASPASAPATTTR